MNQSLHSHHRTGTPAEASPDERAGRKGGFPGVLPVMLFVGLLLASGLAQGGGFSPPPPPKVAPIVSVSYPSDLDGNRINDELERQVARPQGLSVAGEDSFAGPAVSEDGKVAVELAFSEPVTQRQIDDFLALGGEITYMFRAISFGWNGRIPREHVTSLPSVMGPALVQVEPIWRVAPCMDRASQTGRVRPIWRAGFAGSASGFSGDPNTTIAVIDTGVDGTHIDLAGRSVYWHDFTDDNEPDSVDFFGHGSLAAGIAVGTGQAGGTGDSPMSFSYSSDYAYWGHFADAVVLPSGGTFTMQSRAYWKGPRALLFHTRWTAGTPCNGLGTLHGASKQGNSPLTIISKVAGTDAEVFSTAIQSLSSAWLENVVLVTSVTPYPGARDGFNTFRGVAPGCKWAAAKVYTNDGESSADPFSAALDDFVVRRVELNIKIINHSHGIVDFLGYPAESSLLRDKINTIVHNGVIVVVSAGNGGEISVSAARKMGDPARAAMAITVGAVNDENALTRYSSDGFTDPRKNEDYKPDVLAPGGSLYYTGIISVDSGTSDGVGPDREPNDYASMEGTSFSAPFVAGCAALVIEAIERQGVVWDFASSEHARYVKMLLCATASETNAKRERDYRHPTLQRAAAGPGQFPVGKDAYEGYGIVNPDAAVEAVSLTHTVGSSENDTLGARAGDKRVWARTIQAIGERDIFVSVDVPAAGDFDLFMYSMVPSDTGTPILLAGSTQAGAGVDEAIHYVPAADMPILLVVKRVSGTGQFTISSRQAAPPVAQDGHVTVANGMPVKLTLQAADDGSPVPPGALTYTITSLPQHGRLEHAGDGAPISEVPAVLPDSANQVIYRSDADWAGQDSFTFHASDGGTLPFGGQSNTATMLITVVTEMTVECQVSAGVDDAHGPLFGSYQGLNEGTIEIGSYIGGMRFRNIQIPQGVIVKRATLSICSGTDTLTGQITVALHAEAADNPPDFSNRRVAVAKRTSASQEWNWGDTEWTANTWYNSPEIRHVLQEVIDRPGWSAGHAIVILCSSSSYEQGRRFWAYDGAADKAARLSITYTPR